MSESSLTRGSILDILKGLNLPRGEYWLTSGAALVLYGVKETTRDVDLICTRALANRLEAQGVPFRRDGLDGTRIFALSPLVEVLEDWETERVIELEGFPAASLLSIRKQKEKLGREKDMEDITRIDQFLYMGSQYPVFLETPRLILRDYTPSDEEDYYRLKTDEKTMGRYMRDIMLHSRAEASEEFSRVLADAASPSREFYFLRAELRGNRQQVGSVGYTVTERTPVGKLVHAGYFYLSSFWGQGYGTEAMKALIRFAFLEDGVYRITTGCLQENRGSERIMQKCGLIKEAEHLDWEWHDGQMKTRLEYRLLRHEYLKQQAGEK